MRRVYPGWGIGTQDWALLSVAGLPSPVPMLVRRDWGLLASGAAPGTSGAGDGRMLHPEQWLLNPSRQGHPRSVMPIPAQLGLLRNLVAQTRKADFLGVSLQAGWARALLG